MILLWTYLLLASQSSFTFSFLGTWGVLPKKEVGEVTESQVRIPAKFVARLIGERGKTVTEISRDSKTKINIPRFTDETNVVVTITGTKINIKTAQYLMQKLLKQRA